MTTDHFVDDAALRLRLPQLRSIVVVDDVDVVELLRSVRAQLAASTLRVRYLAVETERLAALDAASVAAFPASSEGVDRFDDPDAEVAAHREGFERDVEAARAAAELRITDARREAAELLARAAASIESLVLEFVDRGAP